MQWPKSLEHREQGLVGTERGVTVGVTMAVMSIMMPMRAMMVVKVTVVVVMMTAGMGTMN